MTDAELGALSVTTVLVMAAIYLAPGIIAILRSHHNAGAIFALNLFLGWSLIGWVGSLVWAFTATRNSQSDSRNF